LGQADAPSHKDKSQPVHLEECVSKASMAAKVAKK